jgi:hypothetical protein
MLLLTHTEIKRGVSRRSPGVLKGQGASWQRPCIPDSGTGIVRLHVTHSERLVMDTAPNQDAQFQGSKLVRVSPDDVFAFISRIENLPSYLAMVTEASDRGNDRIDMTVNLRGHEHSDTGTFRRFPSDRRIEWGSEEGDYSGSLVVTDEDGDARLTMQLTWAAESPFPERMGGEEEGQDSVNDAIDATLDSVKNILEGTGGAVHPDDAEA